VIKRRIVYFHMVMTKERLYLRKMIKTLPGNEITKNSIRLAVPKTYCTAKVEQETKGNTNALNETKKKRKYDNRVAVNSLELPKYNPIIIRNKSSKVNNEKNKKSTEKIPHTKFIPQQENLRKIYDKQKNNDIQSTTKLLTSSTKRKEESHANRGKPKKLIDLESFINRLSTPKQYTKQEINRNVKIEKRVISPSEINALCNKLSDKRYALIRTPDTKRVLNRSFTPVNTYAWQGIGYNVDELSNPPSRW